ncbi:hypothetical protein RF11_07944 [Thelohanellus kitauei]|uniref:Uncharacterized protein n=1 Tax=Thelohanellus kitauei TaxID=669202 RepID=A0A0C2MN23_THEKT|nr:hypothetical protein RF11_07944 [Thelohanellus kitauei]
MEFLLDSNWANRPRSAIIYPDICPQVTRDRGIISHLFHHSKRYEDLDNSTLIVKYCMSISAPTRYPLSYQDRMMLAQEKRVILRECNEVMKSIASCIRNDLKQRLIQRFGTR